MSEIKQRLIDGELLNSVINTRLSKVPEYQGEATYLKDPFHRGKATSYDNVLHDIDAMPEVSSDQGKATRLREALEFYADPATYDIEHLDKHGYIVIDKDGGQKAREALSSHTEDTGIQKVRPEVQWFAEHMELTLKKNDHKGGWGDCDINWLLGRLQEEKNELSSALFMKTDPHRVISEATDVANFAMMIADNARRAGGITIPVINTEEG